jgi:hypothetical protein
MRKNLEWPIHPQKEAIWIKNKSWKAEGAIEKKKKEDEGRKIIRHVEIEYYNVYLMWCLRLLIVIIQNLV